MNRYGAKGVVVCVRPAAKKFCSLASVHSFRAFKGEMPESGGAKLLKWGILSGRGRIRPIFVFGDAFFRRPKGKVTGSRWLVAGRSGSTCYWQDNPRESWQRGWGGEGDEAEGRKRRFGEVIGGELGPAGSRSCYAEIAAFVRRAIVVAPRVNSIDRITARVCVSIPRLRIGQSTAVRVRVRGHEPPKLIRVVAIMC